MYFPCFKLQSARRAELHAYTAPLAPLGVDGKFLSLSIIHSQSRLLLINQLLFIGMGSETGKIPPNNTVRLSAISYNYELKALQNQAILYLFFIEFDIDK